MRSKPTSIRLAVCAALGVVALAPVAAAAAAPVKLPNGIYQAIINPSPVTSSSVSANIVPGTDGAWNSSFSFSHLPSKKSQSMRDNATDIACGGGGATCGSSQLGNGAGSWIMKVTGNSFTTSNFQVDSIYTTAGGTFVEYGHLSGGTLNVNADGSSNLGAMSLDTTGRLGAVSNFSNKTTTKALYNEPWNIPDSGTTSTPLITGKSTNPNGPVKGVTGHGIVASTTTPGDYNVILVSASTVGSAWGGFDTNPYVEAWNVTLKPLLIAANETASAQPGVAKLIDVKKNDTGSGVAASIIVLPKLTSAKGGALIISAGKVSYTALSGYSTDTFQYELKDSQGGTTPPATVTVTVAAVVTATPDTANTPEGQSVPIDVLKNDSGATSATVTISTPPVNGSATANSSNQVVYTPTSGFVGTDTFDYTDTVNGKASKPATVTVTVNAAFQAVTSGVSVGPGAIAKADGMSGLVTTQQLATAGILADSGVSQQCIGGCFDFKVTGVGAGGQAKLAMLPLTKPIPSSARLRKYISGKWQDFDTSTGDRVASALGSAKSCPLPSSTSYKTGLTAGDYCVRLAITDGGPNDNDKATAGVIADPSGIATGTGTSGATTTTTTTTTTTDFKGLGSGGCALGTDASPWHGGSWWLIGAVIGWLGFSRRRRSPQRS